MSLDLVHLLETLLREEQIFIDKEELRFQLLSHPNYPSLNAFTGVLDHLSIGHLAVELPVLEATLVELPTYFLAHLDKAVEEQLVLVKKAESGELRIVGDKEEYMASSQSFLEKWSGVVLVIDDDAPSISKARSRTFSFKLTLTLLFCSLLALVYWQGNSFEHILFYCLSIFGTGLSFLVLTHDYGHSASLLNAFCKTGDCDEVLNSKESYLLGDLKLGDLGLIYFSGLTIFGLLTSLSGQTFGLLFAASLLALPITIYSIYQQYFVLKKWCRICLVIIGVLWVQAMLGGFGLLMSTPYINTAVLLLLVFSVVVAISIWWFVRKQLQGSQELERLRVESMKIKRNKLVINTLFGQEASYPKTTIPNEIVLGAKHKAAVELIIVTNPLCSHCKEVHQVVHQLYKRGHKDLKIIIRQRSHPSPKNPDYQIAHRLLDIFHGQSEAHFIAAIDEVYSDIGHSNWLAKYGSSNNDQYHPILENEYNWCTENEVNFTPAIIVNGQSFPKDYNRKDLLFLIDDFLDEVVEKREELLVENDAL